MSSRPVLTFTALAALALSGCETTNSEDWSEHRPSVPFDRAEQTCEELTREIDAEENRPGYFVKCMDTLGWTPNAGTEFATPWDAPDPS